MKNKLLKLLIWLILFCICAIAIWKFDINNMGFGEAIAGAFIGFFVNRFLEAIQDLTDNNDWKMSQRKLIRGKYITDETIVRISFAYLYRIKIGDKYMLVQNERNTGKYQPVGGVYKMQGNEKMELKNRYKIMDDNKILIDESSRDDYRLCLKNKYLRSFVCRFDRKADRERIDDISREFREELLDSGIIDWRQIKYRFCGRHITELKYSNHFQIYELLLADIVELIPTEKQEQDLEKLLHTPSDKYKFVTAEQIKCFGIDTKAEMLKEWIADHSIKVLQENEDQLIKIKGVGLTYRGVLNNLEG